MDFKIKKFKELSIGELYEILKLRNEVFVVEQDCVYQDCDGKDYDSYHIFEMVDGEVSCYIRVVEKDKSNPEVSIGRVVVNEKYRNKGVARKIMLKGIDFAKNELGKKVVRISAQEYLNDFYTSLGFKKVSDTYLEDGIPHIAMMLEL